MVVSGCFPIEIVRDTQLFEVLGVHSVVSLGDDLCGYSFFVRPHGGRCPVHVASAHHEDVVSHHAMVAGKDVGRNVRSRNVANVPGSTRVGPGHAQQ